MMGASSRITHRLRLGLLLWNRLCEPAETDKLFGRNTGACRPIFITTHLLAKVS